MTVDRFTAACATVVALGIAAAFASLVALLVAGYLTGAQFAAIVIGAPAATVAGAALIRRVLS